MKYVKWSLLLLHAVSLSPWKAFFLDILCDGLKVEYARLAERDLALQLARSSSERYVEPFFLIGM